MKRNIYKIDNSIERLNRGSYTLFLDQKEFKIIKNKFNKKEYNIYYLYNDSDRVILYKKELPKIKVIKINTNDNIRHQDILGSILNLGIASSYIGDIIKYNNFFYIYILEEISDFIKENLNQIANKKVILEEIDNNILSNYQREYEEIKLIISSLRIDNIISSIIGCSRKQITDKIKNKDIIVNSEILNKNSYTLKENDIFSIKRYGKYKYIGIEKYTKKGNLIVTILKYR